MHAKFMALGLLMATVVRADPLAWTRLGAPDGVRYRDLPYHWLADAPLQLKVDVAPAPGLALDLQWGAKNDQRGAEVVANGKPQTFAAGGYDGFRWQRIELPATNGTARYDITLRPGAPKAAFLAAARVVRADAPLDEPLPAGPARGIDVSVAVAPAVPDWLEELRQPGLDPWRRAEIHGRQAGEALQRCRRYVDGWLAHADPATGLIPRNLRESRHFWNGRDAAADNYAFMVLTCALTDHAMRDGRMLDMLRTETRLTSRVDRLPDDFDFGKQGWRREQVDLDAIVFDGAEYVKDGLLYIAEWMGSSPWTERMTGIVDDIWKHAPVDTPAGRIPTLNFEVNGDLLQACSRLFWFTGDRRYLDRAIRLGDYYLLGNHHPTRDMKELRLGDHSCEVINGLSELYVAVSQAAPEKKKAYEGPLHELYDRILATACDERGLMYLQVDNATGKHGDRLTDNWGYNYDGIYTAYLLDGTTAYRDAVRKVLENLPSFAGYFRDMDSLADSIEGAITLYNREPVPQAVEYIEREIRSMWSIQKPDGVIEGWHGDGNFARTSMMFALWKMQGCHAEPWRPDVRAGAVRDGARLLVRLEADAPWTGRLVFDRPRHKTVMHLPLDYPRINQFPEWFTTGPGQTLRVTRTAAGGAVTADVMDGRVLTDGLDVTLAAGTPLRIVVEPAEASR